MTNEQDFLQEEELVANQEEQFDGAAPDADEAAKEAKDERIWTLEDGTEVSKSEFVRHQFTEHNLSRKEISEKFDINYRTVYGATVNMVNEAEPTTRGRSAANTKINVTEDQSKVVDGNAEEGYTVEGEAYEGEVVEVDRNTWIKEQVAAGVSRGDIAKALDLSYGAVYSLTKDAAGSGKRHEVEYEGKTISRSEYIRILHGQGMEKAEIAKHLEVDYPVVWAALKSLTSDQEKFVKAVEKLEKYADQVVDPEGFKAALEALKEVEFKEEEEASETSEEQTEGAEDSVYAE